MKNIKDYSKKIENLSKDSCYFDFKKFQIYHEGLHITIDNNGENLSYILFVEGNDIFGYNLISSKVMFDYGQRKEQNNDFEDLEKIVIFHEKVADKLDFNNLIVRVDNPIIKRICIDRKYLFEEENENQVAVKKLK